MPIDGIVHVIDGSETVREAIAVAMRSARLRVQTHGSGASFLGDPSSGPRGCIVAELHLPDMGALEFLAELRGRGRETPVIVIAGNATVRSAVAAMRAGAVDFLEKPVDRDELLAAVQSAMQRHCDAPAGSVERSEILSRLETLSARERQVLDALVAGRPNKIIAYELGISIRTIEIYRANVMTKMRAASLSELVRMAIFAGASPARKAAAG